jgi:exonuclease III
MPRFLFWNYRNNGPDREELLARVVHHEAVDVLILTESRADPAILIDRLSSNGRTYRAMPLPHSRIQIYAGYPSEVFADWARDDLDRLCLRRFQPPGHPEILLAAVHLVSGLHRERSERKSEAATLARVIRRFQLERNHARVIVVGDFNLNPFDDGMISTEGFGAMMTKSLVKKYALSHDDRFSRFYNPIWSRLGREATEGPPGTYYWRARREMNLYWNYVDQVLVGHDLLDHFPESRFRILTSIPDEERSRQLIRETDRHWKIGVSDHLPLLFDVELPEETDHGQGNR